VKLTSPRAYSVIQYLLKHQRTNQLEISRKTGIAYGWVNEVINFLYDRGVVSKGWRQCMLKEPVQLLEIIALERPLDILVKESFRLEALSIAEGEEQVRRAFDENRVKYGLTVFSGLKRFYEYYITFPRIDVYVSDESAGRFIQQGRGPVTVNLISPDYPSILRETEKIEGFSVCAPLQVVIDLFCSGVGRDAAMKLLEAIHNGKI
jgi:hypothetical protein